MLIARQTFREPIIEQLSIIPSQNSESSYMASRNFLSHINGSIYLEDFVKMKLSNPDLSKKG